MNKATRDRIERAEREGAKAFRDGLPLDSNPYKMSKWGMGGFWQMGWQREKSVAEPNKGKSVRERYLDQIRGQS